MDDLLVKAALERLKRLELKDCFDPFKPDSRPTTQQLDIFKDAQIVQHRWVVAGNQSGKSAVGGRDCAWFINDEHPYFKRPDSWTGEPLLIIIAGQSRQMMEVELWNKKLKPFLVEGEWKPKRQGGQLISLENQRTKDMIIFLSHADGSEKNRKYMQGFVAHYVWMDEMPSDIRILDELIQRVASKQGLFMGTFTNKSRNDSIRKFVDAVQYPIGKKYRLSKLDNPIYADRKQQEIDKLKGLPQHVINTILYGDWAQGDQFVYQFDSKTMVEKPQAYRKDWRHVESSDPAISSKFGFTLWAEDPSTGIWYCIQSRYITGIATPERLVEEVKRLTRDTNVVRRVCDPHEVWYINTALEMGLHYVMPHNKNNRKDELIKGLQSAISDNQIKIAPWCSELIEEFQNCQWSGTSDQIVNARSYHTLDTAQYFVDCMPKALQAKDTRSHAQRILDGHYARKKRESLQTVNRSRRSKWAVSSRGSFRLR